MIFANVTAITILEGNVTKIEANGAVLWQLAADGSKNWVQYAIDTDGSLFNGCGYKDGYRVSSSGSIKYVDDSNTCTGYIKMSGGDIVRVSGVIWAGGNDSSGKAIAFFDSSFNWLGTATYQNGGLYYGICNTSSLQFSEADGICTFTTPDNSSIAYVVISGIGEGANMIVTINEEITK